MWSHDFTAQKWPHIVKVMPFFIKVFLKTIKKRLWAAPILVYPYLLMLKKKPRLLLYSRNLFPKSQVKILKIWAWMLRYQLLRQGAFVLCKEANFSFWLGLGLGSGFMQHMDTKVYTIHVITWLYSTKVTTYCKSYAIFHY